MHQSESIILVWKSMGENGVSGPPMQPTVAKMLVILVVLTVLGSKNPVPPVSFSVDQEPVDNISTLIPSV